MIKRFSTALFLSCVAFSVQAQEIPEEYNGVVYRGAIEHVARGIIDGNLIETNYRNHGEMARWGDIPWGVWPRNIGGRHIDGVGVIVAGKVLGQREKYPEFYEGAFDTVINPLIINYRDAGKRLSPINGDLWGWLPLPGFNNPNRADPITNVRTPTPAISSDTTSWPNFWPDRINEEIVGWAGSWNGLFGRNVLNADFESYYVMDDFSDLEYSVNPETGLPLSPFGVYYPDPSDSTMGGLGMQVKVRLLQWANVLAEDTMFLLYTITNKGATDHRRLQFVQIVDYGLGQDEADDNAAYNPLLDVVYGWDNDGIGAAVEGGGTYPVGYTGFAFLESPANDDNFLDDDQDGITDESRFDENYFLVQGQTEIMNYAQANYNVADFENYFGPITERPAYEAGIWYTTDENMDWVGFEDINQNGQIDDGESLNNDVGRDGLSIFDVDYLGPDEGEGDGIPTQGEPNYNELDVDESDQIGLTGFDLNTRPFYESGNNLRDDTWLYARIELSRFPLGQEPVQSVADDEPFALFMSGDVQLFPDETDFFSTAWIFGDDVDDFFKNRRTVQNIYNADYNFAQPPLVPTLTAEPGDGQVILSWDNLSVDSFDRFLQDFDFEGYKLYKGTNNLLTDARTITDVNGTPTFYEPIAQYDLDNGINGTIPVLDNTIAYDLGDDTGLSFSYVDDEVQNGKYYYYALVAYDRGFIPPDTSNAEGIDPQENVFRISVDISGNVTGTSKNAAVVVPKTRPAGFTDGGSTVDLSEVTNGTATGAAQVNIVVNTLIDPTKVYKIEFFDTLSPLFDFHATSEYRIIEMNSLDTLVERSPYNDRTPIIDGFTVDLFNDEPVGVLPERTGFVSNEGTENELYGLDATELDGVDSDWVINVLNSEQGTFVQSNYDFELRFVDPNDSLYTPPRVLGGGFNRIPIPIYAYNLTLDQPADLFVVDGSAGNPRNDIFDVGDKLEISDFQGGRQYFQRYRIDLMEGTGFPAPGTKIRVSSRRAFGDGDYFQFAVRAGSVDEELASSELDDIYVVPNPYIGTASWERSASASAIGRGERKISFFNVPQTCTIRIFNIRGELVKIIYHNGTALDGQADWDLRTDNNEDVAYGIYFYHVDAPGIGTFKDKFAVIK